MDYHNNTESILTTRNFPLLVHNVNIDNTKLTSDIERI